MTLPAAWANSQHIAVHNTFDIIGGFSLHLDTELIKRGPSRIFIRLIKVSIDVTRQILSDPAGSLLMQILGGVRRSPLSLVLKQESRCDYHVNLIWDITPRSIYTET